MKLQTEQLLGTLEVLNEHLYNKTFFWDASVQGDFNVWNLIKFEKLIEPVTPEAAIEKWIQEEQMHHLLSPLEYPGEEPELDKFLDDKTKLSREKKYQSLLNLLKSNLEHIEAFKFQFPGYDEDFWWLDEIHEGIYPHKDFICGLIGKTFDDDWISITPTIPTRHTFLPEEIAVSDYQFTINQNLGENILNLELNIKSILEELTPLKLAICYPAGYSYSYIYQHCSSISQTKESVITQSFLKSGLFKIYKFQDFLSERDNSHYYESLRRKREQILSRFFKATFSQTKIYHLALYDIDYTYILGETPDKNYFGIKMSGSYEYNP
ncbi:hypothetical protein NIES267_51220 [Calothrix parasitica NIES-267]|uniref:Uncharacterized protein n=1 Tax=Calothrix parasitica NIES-267 TaxID=1973488 RepID=A0A1Z4LWV3_9CYAN|nr:hypothetical protein NIES267_51220 [Calothrix parasitica NIES-267]